MSTETTPAAETPPAPAAGEPAAQKTQLDQVAYAKIMQEVGEKNALKRINDIFGTTDPEKLKEIAAATKDGKPAKQIDEDAQQKITALSTQLEELKTASQRTQHQNKLMSAIIPLGAKFPDLIATHFDSKYELREYQGKEYVFEKGSTTGVLVDNKMVGITEFMASLSRSQEYAPLFGKGIGSQGQHVNTDGAQALSEIITPEMAKDRKLMQAVIDSGEESSYVATGKVNMAKVKKYVK